MKLNKHKAKKVRHLRIRKKIIGTSEIPRLNVFRSNKNFYVQLIDDSQGKILTSSSTLQLDLTKNNKESAMKVGDDMAKKINSLKIKEVKFDRGGYLYHGKIAAMCDQIRKEGIKF